jgi:hypothetical protein
MTVFLFIALLFFRSPATTTPAPTTGSAVVKSSSGDVPCTAENPDPHEACNIVWGS